MGEFLLVVLSLQSYMEDNMFYQILWLPMHNVFS